MRIKFFTVNSLQIRYLMIILLSILAPVFIVGGCLYYFIFNIMADQLAIPESIIYNLVPVVEKINFWVIVTVPPITILLCLWGMILTHRFIGPLKRIEDDLKKISEGDYSRRLRIRENDKLYPITNLVNKILDKLSKDENPSHSDSK